jgi:hypothetical protein
MRIKDRKLAHPVLIETGMRAQQHTQSVDNKEDSMNTMTTQTTVSVNAGTRFPTLTRKILLSALFALLMAGTLAPLLNEPAATCTTQKVWLTRQNGQGLFNMVAKSNNHPSGGPRVRTGSTHGAT